MIALQAEGMFPIGDAILIAAALGAIVFAISYGAFFNWRKTREGRSLMYFVLSLIAVFVNNVAARLLGPEYPLRDWVRLVVYFVVALTVWRLVLVLWANWRAGKPPLEIESKTRKDKS